MVYYCVNIVMKRITNNMNIEIIFPLTKYTREVSRLSVQFKLSHRKSNENLDIAVLSRMVLMVLCYKHNRALG